MEYNTQNYWVFGLYPSSGILKHYKTQRFGNWICLRLQVKGETSTLLGPLERPNIDHWNNGQWTKTENPVILSV
jgi:hypothetical protein